MALLSIIVTVMYSGFHTMGRIMRRTERTKGAYQTARLIMARVRQDLACAHFSPTRKNFVFRGENIKEVNENADALTFVTTAHVISRRDAPEGDLAEVSYYLDEANPGVLVRREDISPDDELEMGGVLDVLGKNVVGLNFTYLDGREEPARRAGGTTTEQEETLEEKNAWKEEWDTEETPYLPRAVRIDLSVMNEENEIEDFSTTVVLAMGRTATSTVPVAQPVSVPRPITPSSGRPGPQGRPPTLSPREGPRGNRGDRGDFTPDRGERRPGREGRSQSDRSGSTPQYRNAPRIQRNAPNASPGIRPPTRSGR